jgi:hypothetical protein
MSSRISIGIVCSYDFESDVGFASRTVSGVKKPGGGAVGHSSRATVLPQPPQ